MFRIVITKIPQQKINPKCYNGTSRLYKTFRNYSKQAICPPKPPPKKETPKLLYALGAVALITGGTIIYAKQNPEFRIWLCENVPYSDEVLKTIFQEERSFLESFIALLDAIKASLLGLLGSLNLFKSSKGGFIAEKPVDYTPPSPAFNTLAKELKEKEDTYAEIRMEHKDVGDSEPSITVSGEQKPPNTLSDTHPKNIAQLETNIGESASAAVQSYNSAVYAVKNYNLDVEIVIESSIDRLDPKIWDSLREKSKVKDQTVKDAERHAKNATEDIKKLKDILRSGDIEAPDVVKKQVESNISKINEDIANAKNELEKERRKSNITDKYWKKVEEARGSFIDEIQILFPGVNINDRRLDLEGPELDLFILRAFANVLFYQKELFRLQTIEQDKLKSAIDSARRGNHELLTDAQIDKMVQKQKKSLEAEFKKKCMCLRIESERDLRKQLKLQSEAFADHLQEALLTREAELARVFTRQLDEKVNEEKCKYKLQLSALAGRVQGMDKALKAQIEAGKSARQAQVLWSACQALFRSLKAGCPGLPWTEQLRPLEPEISAVKQAAASNDELVAVVLAGIPKEASERGVFPEDALRERFLKVEKICRQVSLVPDGGARLPVHLLSYFQSILLLKAASPIPQAELDDEMIDYSTLSTNEVLQRARYWLDRGDFTQTLKYMNLLDGAPRCVARQWMEETRILLETQQAANTLMAHAAANGLMYL